MKLGLENIMKQAQEMQEKMQRVQQEIANNEVTGEAGAGLVKVRMNGRHEVLKEKLSGLTAGMNLPAGFKLPFQD